MDELQTMRLIMWGQRGQGHWRGIQWSPCVEQIWHTAHVVPSVLSLQVQTITLKHGVTASSVIQLLRGGFLPVSAAQNGRSVDWNGVAHVDA